MPRRVGAYAKLLANYASDDAVIAAGEKAELLFVRGLAFCATSDSDGYITDGQVVRVVGAGMRDATARAKTLVREGLWESVDGGYLVRSWTKIHESAEEKGRQRKQDRDRKRAERGTSSDRSPSGQNDGSERTTNDVTPESLLCSYVSSEEGTEQSKTEQQQSSAETVAVATAHTAQTIVAEWMEHCDKRPPGQVIGHASKLIRQMLDEGIDADDVRRGVAAWKDKGLHPSALPSVVNEVMNARARRPPAKRTTDDKVREGLELALRLAREEEPQPGRRQIGA